MVRPLLVPTAFLTLAGMCPACLDETRTDAASTVPEEVVAVAVKPSGNGRTPGYDAAVMGQRVSRSDAGVALVAEPARREADPIVATTSPTPSTPASSATAPAVASPSASSSTTSPTPSSPTPAAPAPTPPEDAS